MAHDHATPRTCDENAERLDLELDERLDAFEREIQELRKLSTRIFEKLVLTD